MTASFIVQEIRGVVAYFINIHDPGGEEGARARVKYTRSAPERDDYWCGFLSLRLFFSPPQYLYPLFRCGFVEYK